MSDQYREPIESGDDMNLREKFVGGGGATGVMSHFEKPKAQEKASEKAGAEKSGTYNKLLKRIQNDDDDDDSGSDVHDHAHHVASDARTASNHPDVKSQVNHLIELATLKGVMHAVKTAQHMSDYYILDKMHDKMLSEELHAELEKKGMI